MILIDANLLIYAVMADFPQHPACFAWLSERLGGADRVGMPWPSLLGFLRVTTNARAFHNPLPIEGAWRQVMEWLNSDAVWIPGPTLRHAAILGELMPQANARANLVPDAHLAALAIEHGLTLCSTDGDFARFQGLSWKNPIA